MRFQDKVALITAAASGIGRATAEIIAAEGRIIAAVDTDPGRLASLTQALQGQGAARTPSAAMPSTRRR